MRTSRKKDIKIYVGDSDHHTPKQLLDIQTAWSILSNNYGDHGSCVLGGGFEFIFEGIKYYMSPNCHWQGSLAWEHYADIIKEALTIAGATDIYFDYGRMD